MNLLFIDSAINMIISCKDKKIQILNRFEAVRIEVEFNTSEYGKLWAEIGDSLYNFTDIEIDQVQFDFMLQFLSDTRKNSTHLNLTVS